MAETPEWVKTIRDRATDYKQRFNEIRTVANEIKSELDGLDWQFESDNPICITVAINGTAERFTEAEIWEAQQVYEFDEVGNQVATEKTSVKEALIKLILSRFKWTAEQQ